MATTDNITSWDNQVSQLRESMGQRFQNPQAKDIATHCVALLQDAITIERNFSEYQGSTGKGETYNTKNSPR